MKLHSELRKHYTKKSGNKWVPKRAFKTKDQVKEELGFDVDPCRIYDCAICGALHIATYVGK